MKSSVELLETALGSHNQGSHYSTSRAARSSRAPAYRTSGVNLSEYLFQFLDVDVLLQEFWRHVQQVVSLSSITFVSKQLDVEFAAGNAGSCKLAFGVDDGDRYLGALEISRSQQFLSHEIRTIDSLVNALRGPLRNASLYRKACQSAYVDQLTGLQNRAAFDQSLRREIAAAHRYNNPLTLIVLDVDRFKSINDNYGHAAGDEVLRQFASCVNQAVRDSDLVYRYGGDEFVIALTNTALGNGLEMAERIRSTVEKLTLQIDLKRIRLTATIGISELLPDESMDDAFLRADAALLKGKRLGRNRVFTAERAFAQGSVS